MSIILQALRTRAVQGAPWTATLHAGRLGVRLPAWLSARRAVVPCVVAMLGVATTVLATRAARPAVVDPASVSASTAEEVDIPMLQSLPLAAQARPPATSVAASASASMSASVSATAGGVRGPAESAGGLLGRPGAALPPGGVPVPGGRLPLASALPRGVYIAPPGSLSTPLPLPGALLPPGAVPGQVPPPPGAGATWASVSPGSSGMPAPQVPQVPVKPPVVFQTVGELPPALRGAIEGVRVQLHLYAPVSRQRWLMVGGKRLREGDDLVDGVRLEEITPQGVVLTQGAQRFQVKTSSLQGGSA